MKMKKSSWRKCHKWLGIAFCFFMLMFGISGIVLNHRHWYGNVNVSRNCLPETFRFERWNNGLLRGTLAAGDSVLVYGAGGVFATDSTAKSFRDFSAGMPEGADARNVRAVVKTPSECCLPCRRSMSTVSVTAAGARFPHLSAVETEART